MYVNLFILVRARGPLGRAARQAGRACMAQAGAPTPQARNLVPYGRPSLSCVNARAMRTCGPHHMADPQRQIFTRRTKVFSSFPAGEGVRDWFGGLRAAHSYRHAIERPRKIAVVMGLIQRIF